MNPRQTVLLANDALAILAHTLGADTVRTIIDGGANVGDASCRFATIFPRAMIHAFEPVSACFDSLAERAAGEPSRDRTSQIRPIRCALGAEPGRVSINVNKNLWTSSLLTPSERGLAYHGEWYERVASETVEVVTLDGWAASEGVGSVDILKLDLQGFEGPALRGAERMLRSTRAVYAEAQFIPEYDGASMFSEIDGLLRRAGFGLYQLTDLCLKGEHGEPLCCDGLWLRNDELARVRCEAPPPLPGGKPARMVAALERCEAAGRRRVAIYGAGAHTIDCAPALAVPPVEVVAFIDDAASRRGRLWGTDVVSLDEVSRLAIDAIVVSSDRFEPAMADRARAALAGTDIAIETLYAARRTVIARAS